MNSVGMEAKEIVARPVVLGLSMEKRIKPRSQVISWLVSQGLVVKDDVNYFTMLKMKSSEFVMKHQKEMPELVQALTRVIVESK